MHIRKQTLHCVLLRFQIPLELRWIIIEDFYPFLPTKPRLLMNTCYHDYITDEACWKAWRINCFVSAHLCYGQMTKSVNLWYTDRYDIDTTSICNGECHDPLTFVMPCGTSTKISDFSKSVRFETRINKKYNDTRSSHKWFYDVVLSLIDE